MTSGMDIVEYAKKSLGVKYVWGGTDLQKGMDCSGLVMSVFAHFGITVPRVTYNQINTGSAVRLRDLRPGDLLFFETDSSQAGPDHVGIYMGGGQFIQAPKTGDVVKISKLDGWYADHYTAARRISGVTGGTDGADTATAAPEVPKMDGQELAEKYGLSMAFFDSVPELRKLLDKAVAGQWSETQWTGQLKNSKWWADTSEQQRKMKILETGDPATYKAQLTATTEAMRMAAVKMGAVVSDGQLGEAAKLAMNAGWNEEQVKSYLGKYIDFTDKQVLGGQAGAWARAINEAAYQNGLVIDDQTVKNYAAYIGQGITTLEDTLGQIREQAAGQYPAFADQIRAGQTMNTLAQPYIQMYAQETGQSYSSMSATTPVIKNALNRRGQDNMAVPMTMSEFQQQIRGSSEWRSTPTAIAKTMGIGGAVLQSLGLVT